MPRCFKCGTPASVGEVAIWNKFQWHWVRNAIDEWEESTKTWKRQPQLVWKLPGWTIEPCDVYCRRCWKDWGQHVKPGCTYELSKACEELAIRVGIQFAEDPLHNGNPFYCPPCGSYFNHRATSLEKHLHLSHRDQVLSHCDQVLEATRARLDRKRKSEALAEETFIPEEVHVSWDQNSTVGRTLAGHYIVKCWHHGKPLYQKQDANGCDEAVVIYFWDSRDGDRFHGWWFSPEEGSSKAWACNSGNLGPDELTVPAFGWTVPWDGEVYETLIITTKRGDDCKTVESNVAYELRWEFVASADGEEEEWQPMSKDMNDALEKRWAEGWDGDNGSDDFYIQSNGFTYGIDSYSMVQWNVRTKRSRKIRRGEARLTLEALLPKLAQKGAQVEKLEAEKASLMQEKHELIAKVAQLELLGAQLEQEKKTLQTQAQADHATQMISQETWRMGRQLQTQILKHLNVDDAVFLNIQRFLIQACPSDHYGVCSRMRNLNIVGLQQVCNVRIWKNYEFRKEQIRKELEGSGGLPIVSSNLQSGACNWADLDAKINEILVIHGTTQNKTNEIANFGFDERLARERGLYGQGVYFTDQSCKSLQYSGAGPASSNSGCFIIARVILGRPFIAQGPLKQLKVEPLVDSCDPSKGRCHSVIAQPGTPTGGQRQVHREFVLFDGAQAYPEMIVHFRIS